MEVSRAALQYPDRLNVAQELLSPRLSEDGSRPAILYKGERISYTELSGRVVSCASELVRRGIRPGQCIAHRIPNRPEFVIVWLALQWVGSIAVSIPPVYRRREIAHVVNHSEATAIIHASDLLEDLVVAQPDFARDVMLLDASVCCAAPGRGPVPPVHPFAPHDPAIITYITSADGPPRGVVQSPAEILAGADAYSRDVLQLTPRDVCAGHLALAWAYGLGQLLVCPLRAGAATVLLDGLSPTLLEAVVSSRATILVCVPTMYRLLLRQPDLASFDLSGLRRCVSSAEPLPASVAEEWQNRTGHEILNGLGTTELGHIVISSRAGAPRAGNIGTPVGGYEARILLDPGSMESAPDGAPGCLAVRGPTRCHYWRDPDAERRAVRDGWTMTGDICVRREDGSFEYCRRADTLIVSGGYKISPAEVVRALLDHPAVADAAIVEAPDPIRGAVPTAVVAPATGVEWPGLVETLQQYLKRELASYKCPREIRLKRLLTPR